jgi:hypothetical protein
MEDEIVKKRKVLEGSHNMKSNQGLSFRVFAKEDTKFKVMTEEPFMAVDTEEGEREFNEITFDNSRLLAVLEALGFDFNKNLM